MIRSYKEEQELKEKILELRKKNYPYDKIAMELGTNESRVKLIIGLLVEEGKLDSLATNLYKKETEEKLKQILSMAKAKRNVSEISSSLGISVDRTYLYLDRLVEEGRLSIAEVYQCADEEIEKRVIELRKAGLGQREIMKEMKITKQDTLRRILDKLFSEGKIDSYKKVDKTKKRIVELLKYGYNAEEISRQLVKDEQNIRSLMAELIRDGVITQDEITQAREAKKEKINQQIDDLANNVLEMTPEEFMKMRATSFGGRGRPSYALTKNFAGVYILFNQSKNMYYVGQGKQVLNRVNAHFTGKGNGDVYADYKYGDSFTIKMIALENSGFDTLNELERHTIARYNAFSKGYNKTRGNRN